MDNKTHSHAKPVEACVWICNTHTYFYKLSMTMSLLIIFCFLFSCTKAQPPYVLSHIPRIQNFEKQDHKFCASLKLDFDAKDNTKSKFYWRCRLSLAKYKIQTSNDILATQNNAEIDDLIAKVSVRIANTPETVLMRENKYLDSRQHKQCLNMGFVFESVDQAKIDDYFACRKALIGDYFLIPPFGNKDYLQYKNPNYNIGFVIDQRIDTTIKLFEEAKEKYPTCIKYNLNSVDFKNCTKAQDNSRQCFAEIGKKKFQKENIKKIACQKQAYIRFPNDLLREEDKKVIEKPMSYDHERTFAALGINNVTDFGAETKKAEDKKNNELKKAEEINSKKGLYEKYELTQLRQKYVIACQNEAQKQVDEYVDSLKNTCESLIIFTEVGEE